MKRMGRDMDKVKFLAKKTLLLLFPLALLFLPHGVLAISVSVTADPHGTVSLDATTGGTLSNNYATSTRILVKANPDSGYTFAGWTGTFSGQSSIVNTTVTSPISTLATFSVAPSAIMTINNKCVARIITYNISQARATGGNLIIASKAQVYVLYGSSFTSPVQDVSGYLPQSPNQAFYYAFNAGTIGAGTYSGSNAAFAGNTTYLSLGSATVTSDVNYNCSGIAVNNYTVTFTTNLPTGITATLTGAGTYQAHSNVTVTASAVSSYKFVSFSGNCGAGVTGYDGTGPSYAFLSPNNAVQTSYSYTLSDIQSNCYVVANYQYIPPDSNKNYTVQLTADPHGTVTLNGNTGGTVYGTYPAGTTITVSANPDSGYQLSNWSDQLYGKGSPYTFVLTGNINALASFVLATTTTGSGSSGSPAPLLLVNAQPNNAAGYFMTDALYSHSFGINLQDGYNGTLYNNTQMPAISVYPNKGYTFQGWIGNLASSTMAKINAGDWSHILMGDINGITNPTITAVFIFNGQITTGNNTNSFPEVISTSQTAILDTALQSFNINSNGTYDPSPYSIDSKCVEHVVKFTASRVDFSLFGYPLLSSSGHTYTLYSLDGSDVSALRNGNIVSFKSDPSAWYLRATDDNSDLASGAYTSNSSIFTGSSNSYDFTNVVPISIIQYSCASADLLSSTIKPYFMSPWGSTPFLKGINYRPLIGLSLVNDTTNSSSSLWTNGIDNYVGLGYQRLHCSQGNIGTRVPFYCSSYLSETQTADWNKYRYMWVFSSSPIKGFIHQQISPDSLRLGSPVFGFMYFPKSQSVLVKGTAGQNMSSVSDMQFGITGDSKASSVISAPFYATKIDLGDCKWYAKPSDFPGTYTSCLDTIQSYSTSTNGSNGFAITWNYATNLDVYNANKLNSILLDTASDFTQDVIYYGGLLTSNAKFSVSQGEDVHFLVANKVQRDVVNPRDFIRASDPNNYSTYSTTTTTGSTTPGYYDPPVYHATTTVSATGGTVTYLSGGYEVRTFTASGTLTFSTSTCAVQLFAVGAGGGGGGNNYNGGGGGAGQPYASSTACFNASSYTITIGAKGLGSTAGSVAGGNGGTTTFQYAGGTITLAGGGGGGAAANGGGPGQNGASGGGAGGYNTGASTGGTGYAGYNGGNRSSGLNMAAGGGGCTSAGQDAQTVNGGNGGTGTSTTIRGFTEYFCGGGGGSTGNGSGSGGTGGSGVGGAGNHYAGGGFNAVANTGSGGGGGSAEAGGGTGGNGSDGIFIVKFATTTPGYYDPPVYHATTTDEVTSTTTYQGINASSTTYDSFTNTGFYTFAGDSFAATFDQTIGYNSIADMKAKLLAQYSIESCVATASGVLTGLLCLVTAGVPTAIIQLFVPSADQLLGLQNGVNNVISSGNGMFSLLFSVPLRFKNYGDPDWQPATTTKLSLGFSTSTKIYFNAPTTTPFSVSDYNIAAQIVPYLQVALVLIISGLVISLFL